LTQTPATIALPQRYSFPCRSLSIPPTTITWSSRVEQDVDRCAPPTDARLQGTPPLLRMLLLRNLRRAYVMFSTEDADRSSRRCLRISRPR
jgi:hypothetical protein